MTCTEKGRLLSPTEWEKPLLLLIILAGTVLRLYGLGAGSIWYDESVSLLLAGKDLAGMVAHTAGDIHPPLYYALLGGWTRLAGSSQLAAGFFSMLWGVLLIPLAYRLGRRTAGRDAGLLTAFLVAISPYNVWYSQELRMYTLGACLGIAAVLALRAALREGKPAGWIIYAVSAAAGLYTLYYFAFLLIPLNGWALAVALGRGAERGRRRLLAGWAAANAGALGLYAPWLPVFWRQATQPPVPPWRQFVPVGAMALEGWSALSFGQSVEPAQIWPLLALTLALAGVGAVALLRRDRADGWLIIGLLLGPAALIGLISLRVPLYHVRYLFTYSPAFYVLLGAGLAALSRAWRRRGAVAAALTVLALAGGALFSLAQYHWSPAYAADDHRSAVRYLDEHWRPGDAVLINAGYVYPAFLYYNQLPVAWRGRLSDYGVAFSRQAEPAGLALVQTGSVDGPAHLGWGSPNSDFYAMSRQATAAALARLFADYERVWVYRCYDTVTDPDGFVRAWLEAHGVKFEETPAFAGLSNIRVQGYLTRRPTTALPAGAQLYGALFDGRLELAAVHAPAALGEGPLDVVLWWRATHAPLPRLAVTLRLVDQAERLWAQADSWPLGALYDTSAWPAGALVRQPARLQVPAGLPPGMYRLLVGVYETDSGVAWALPDGQQFAVVGQPTAAGQVAVEKPASLVAQFDGGMQLVQAETAHSVQAGRNLPATLVWRAATAPLAPYVVFVQVLDRTGRLVAAYEGQPAGVEYPTSAWAAGQLVRQQVELHVPADLPAGRYSVIVGLYRVADKMRMRVQSIWPWERRDFVYLGSLDVTTRRPQRELPLQPAQYSGARMGAGIVLVGYTLDTSEARAGGSLSATLVWQAVGPIEADYRVFWHLVDRQGTIWGQADGVPAGGALPTLAWMAGEYVADAWRIPIKAGAPAGDYRLLVGMYELRSGMRPGEPIDLGTVSLH